MPHHRILFLFLALMLATSAIEASTTVVPDNFATIQGALDSTLADTILVRAGVEPEIPTMRRQVVLLGQVGPGGDAPVLDGFDVNIPPDRVEPIVHSAVVFGFRFERPFDLTFGGETSVTMESCVLDSGVTVSSWWKESHFRLTRSTVRGRMTLGATNVSIDGNIVRAPLSVSAEHVSVSGNTCENIRDAALTVNGEWGAIAGNVIRGCDTGLWLPNSSRLTISGNVIEDGGVGILFPDWGAGNVIENRIERCTSGVAGNIDGARISKNVIRDCSSAGIHLRIDGGSRIEHNEITGCGAGIALYGTGGTIAWNRVLACNGTGIGMSLDGPPHVEGNIVGHCLWHGIVASRWSLKFRGNTSYANGGSGFVIGDMEEYEIVDEVTRNIAYGNAGYGLIWGGREVRNFGCNDWFANGAGAISGREPAASDRAVDPRFCDVASDDVSLRADSPVLSGSCGTVGAGALGCDVTTEVQIVLLMAEWTAEGVRIRWELGGDDQPANTWIERSPSDVGPWSQINTDRTLGGSATVELDRGARSDRDYWYRLAWIAASGEAHSSPVGVAGTRPVTAFGLRMIGPNPTQGPVTIEYSLPRTGPVQLTVHDVMGREVARLASGVHDGGRHVVRWTGESGVGQARAGVYFVRLRQAESEESLRLYFRR